MLFGDFVKRELPKTDAEKATLVRDMVNELLERYTPVFDKTTFIVHETDGSLTVAMKWEQK